MIKKIFWSALVALGIQPVSAQSFHCAEDTVKAMEIVRSFQDPGGDPSKICGPIAERLVGVEYVPLTRLDEKGEAPLRLDGLDEMGLVNTVIALARTATSPGFLRLNDLIANLESMTFRRGEPNGFPSRLIYPSDWAVDNKSRGHVKELTETYSDVFKTKSLEYVTRNREHYPALKDSANFERQKMIEMGYRTHKIPHMKRESSDWKEIHAELRDGDLLMLLSSDPALDVFEIGFIVKRDDGFHFIHASEEAGKVVEETEPLGRYIKRNSKKTYGWRWMRVSQ